MAQISRRDFLKGSVATGMLGAVAATGLGCAPAQQTSSEALSETGTVADAAETSSWRVAPESVAEDAIVDETVADIVVIGAGHAGTATARSAAEKSGKSVVLLEALEEQYYTIIGNDIGHLNSQYLKDHGVPEVDPVEFFNDWMMRSQNAANPSLIMQYATRSGEAVDWFLEKVPAELLETMTISYWPRHENMLDEIAGQKFWTGTVQWGMGNEHNMTEVYQAIFASLAELPNLQLIFDRKGVYLEKDGDAVTGVVCVDAAGTYHRYRANEAVVLAAGDFSADKEMMTDLCVTANDCLQEGITEWHDAMGGKDGSGIKMGVWAGGRLEPRPLGSMNGDFAIPSMNPGVGIYLDEKGNRYCNEFFGDPTWTGKPAARIKQNVYYTLFDSKLKETCTYSVSGHTCFDPQEQNIANIAAQFDQGLANGAKGDGRGTYVAEDWDTLAQYMGIEGEAKENMMASIERYNELAKAGVDEDFGKDSRVLFTLDTPPFMGVVAGPDHVGGVMVTVGGLMTDKYCNVLGESLDPIPGLYAAGNCLGQRFGAAYFSPIPGVSIGSAITLGYTLGEHLAES